MKTETKISIMFIFIFLAGTALLSLYSFHSQVKSVRQDYSEDCLRRTSMLAFLCKEAVAGLDFDLLSLMISKFCKQKDALKSFVLEHPGHKILLSTTEGEYGAIFNLPDSFSPEKEEYDGLLYGEYADAGDGSGAILQVAAPVSVAQKKWTLIVHFDKSYLVQKEEALKHRIILEGVLLFVAGSLLMFAAGKIIAKSCSKPQGESYPHGDVFALPELSHDTLLVVRDGIATNCRKLSPDEMEIINVVRREKQIGQILDASPIEDEILTFDLISGLVARGIIEKI